MTSVKDFWYIVGLSSDLDAGRVLGVTLLGEWLAVYRNAKGEATTVIDRCLHRNARLSKGKVKDGELVCPYHGWRYSQGGRLSAIPSEGPNFRPQPPRCLTTFATVEKSGYIYVHLNKAPDLADQANQTPEPYTIPFLGAPGYQHVRLKHVFRADVPGCAENFIDIPHTTYVHPNIFRYEREPQKILAEASLKQGAVHVRYLNETANFGWFSRFLNRQGKVIFHEDHYYLPNITHVEYRFGEKRHFNIVSQSVPVGDDETHVYTDLIYDYGLWNAVAKPFVRWVGKAIIAQDVRIMGQQTDVINKYGISFSSTRADIQHLWIERIYADLRAGKDPHAIPEQTKNVEFWI